MFEFLLHAYVAAVGFVFAGALASLAQVVTGRPLAFAVLPRPALLVPPKVVARVFAGPAILMRNALRGARQEGRGPVWLILSTLVATFWSFLSGVVLLEVLVRGLP